MPRLLTLEFLEGIKDRQHLREIFENCIQTIKQDQLFEKQKGEPYTQDRLAAHIGISSRKIGYGRSAHKNLKTSAYTELFKKLLGHFELYLDASNRVYSPHTVDQDHVLELAGKLALNLVDISTSFSHRISSYDRILDNHILVSRRSSAKQVQRERYIAIVGAGASNAATYGRRPIPTTFDAVQELHEAFNGKVARELIEAEVKRLSALTGREEGKFETQLLALNKFSADIVRKKLDDICGNENAPCLAYEILAHLLKHRFLDAIINFNYDELLDNAIQEELPDNNDYRFIYTAGHCPESLQELRIDRRIKQPIYIKCHGTISQPNSLRFSEDKAFIIEEAIQRHIAELLSGEVPADQQNQLPINLLVFGFGMENYALNRLITKALVNDRQKITIWLFDTDQELQQKILRNFSHLNTEHRLTIKSISLPGPESMGQELVRLWERITETFKKPYRPRGIARHQFIDHLFRYISPLEIGYGSTNSEARCTYYRDRLYAELFILILKSNGIVHLSQIPHSRVGKYLRLLEKEKQPSNIHDYLKDMGMRVYEKFMYDTYLVKDTTAFSEKDKLIEVLRKRLVRHLSLQAKENAQLAKDQFVKLAEKIRLRRLLKVNPKYQHMHDDLFAYVGKGDVMNTSFSWIYNYRRNIEERIGEWDLMLTVSEEGSFLYDDATKDFFADKYFEVILATYGAAGSSHKPRKKLSNLNLLSGKLNYRPWWVHNKHLVLFMKRKPNAYTGDWRKDWELVEGFFYRQNMLSQRVNPIRITDGRDLQRLFYIFVIYWHGSKSDPKLFSDGEAYMNIIATESLLDEVIIKLLKHYETRLHPSK